MLELEIKGFVETSLCDWDGYLASVIFLAGCNFRCPYCQNADLVVRPEVFETIDFEFIAGCLNRKHGWIDGVVITGGEPTVSTGLIELASGIRSLGFKVKLDTNGSMPEVIMDLISSRLVDYVAMDIKAPLDDRYSIAAGTRVNLEHLKESIEIIRGSSVVYEFRTTVVPGIIDRSAVEDIARSIAKASRYVLQRFVPENSLDTSLRTVLPYPDVSGLIEAARKHIENVSYRGKTGAGLSSTGGLFSG